MKNLSWLYKVSMFIALIGWMILIGFPTANFTDFFITLVIVSLLCSIYAYLLFFQKTPKGELYPKGNFKDFQGIGDSQDIGHLERLKELILQP